MMANYMPIPEFGQYVEYITQGPLVDDVYTIIINHVDMRQFDLSEKQSNAALDGDYQKVNNLRPLSDIAGDELEGVKGNLGNVYHSDVVALATQTPNPLPIMNTVVSADEKPAWKPGLVVQIGEVYLYEIDSNLYEVIQAHTTQADWTPPLVHALFKRYYQPSDDPWPWVQPEGAHDAYPMGAIVTHNGFTWQSDIDANVWEPGVYGWTNLTPPPPGDEWGYPIAYKVGDEVTYLGLRYRCLQAHTSQAGWTPPAVPALWQLV